MGAILTKELIIKYFRFLYKTEESLQYSDMQEVNVKADVLTSIQKHVNSVNVCYYGRNAGKKPRKRLHLRT